MSLVAAVISACVLGGHTTWLVGGRTRSRAGRQGVMSCLFGIQQGGVMTRYVVCNRLLDPETNEHCEFDGDIEVALDSSWRCPGCRGLRYGGYEAL